MLDLMVNLAIFSSNGGFTAVKAKLVCAASPCCGGLMVDAQPFTAQNASVDG
jgi:hypothetical protein